MRPIGFSTGAIGTSDLRRGVSMVRSLGLSVVELSTLREQELVSLSQFKGVLDLTGFSHVSIHAPSAFSRECEPWIVETLQAIHEERGYGIVVHPDAIIDVSLWLGLGNGLCLENMDRRKSTARTARELSAWFERLPAATFCLDLGHTRQCDRTMTEAFFFIREFGTRLREVHLSHVTAKSRHVRLSRLSVLSYQAVAEHIPEQTPIILESPVETESEMADEVRCARSALP